MPNTTSRYKKKSFATQPTNPAGRPSTLSAADLKLTGRKLRTGSLRSIKDAKDHLKLNDIHITARGIKKALKRINFGAKLK